jgi:hypothetical protein
MKRPKGSHREVYRIVPRYLRTGGYATRRRIPFLQLVSALQALSDRDAILIGGSRTTAEVVLARPGLFLRVENPARRRALRRRGRVNYAMMSRMTVPWTSVKRKSRPAKRYVNRV